MRNYQLAVPFVSVPYELVAGWADDIYHPDSAAHAIAFSPSEQATLARFDDLFKRWADATPAEDVEAFITSHAGAKLSRGAIAALEAFPPIADIDFDAGLTEARS